MSDSKSNRWIEIIDLTKTTTRVLSSQQTTARETRKKGSSGAATAAATIETTKSMNIDVDVDNTNVNNNTNVIPSMCTNPSIQSKSCESTGTGTTYTNTNTIIAAADTAAATGIIHNMSMIGQNDGTLTDQGHCTTTAIQQSTRHHPVTVVAPTTVAATTSTVTKTIPTPTTTPVITRNKKKPQPTHPTDRVWTGRKEETQGLEWLEGVMDVSHLVSEQDATLLAQKYGIFTQQQLKSCLLDTIWCDHVGEPAMIARWKEQLSSYDTKPSSSSKISFPLDGKPLQTLLPPSMQNFLASIRRTSSLPEYNSRPVLQSLHDYFIAKKTESSVLCDMLQLWRHHCGLPTVSPASLSKYLSRLMVRLRSAITNTQFVGSTASTPISLAWSKGALVILTGTAHSFVVEHLAFHEATAFLREPTGHMAKTYITWRVVQGLPALHGSGHLATISSWKAFVRDAVEMESHDGMIVKDVDFYELAMRKKTRIQTDGSTEKKPSPTKRRKTTTSPTKGTSSLPPSSLPSSSYNNLPRRSTVSKSPSKTVDRLTYDVPTRSIQGVSETETRRLFHGVVWPILLQHHWRMEISTSSFEGTSPPDATFRPIYVCPAISHGELEAVSCLAYVNELAHCQQEIAQELSFPNILHKSIQRMITLKLPDPAGFSLKSVFDKFIADLQLLSRHMAVPDSTKPTTVQEFASQDLNDENRNHLFDTLSKELHYLMGRMMSHMDNDSTAPVCYQLTRICLLLPSLCSDVDMPPRSKADLTEVLQAFLASISKYVVSHGSEEIYQEEYMHGPDEIERFLRRLTSRVSGKGTHLLPSSTTTSTPLPSSTIPKSSLGSADTFPKQEFASHKDVLRFVSSSVMWSQLTPIRRAIEKYHNLLSFYSYLRKSDQSQKHMDMEWLLSKTIVTTLDPSNT